MTMATNSDAIISATPPGAPSTAAALPRARVARAPATADGRLIGRIAGGDRFAMEVLYARHHVRVFRFVLRIVRDEAAAEDLTTETFLEVWRRAGQFEGRSAVSTWMLAIARFKAFGARRRRHTETWDEEAAERIEDPADDPARALERKDASAALRKCLNALPPRHREIIDLAYYHEKSVAEVSAIVGIPMNTVKTRMLRARARLAGLLAAAGIERP
jgi:RNA polymerase sigma-70 factor (ECF subfamily)